MEILFTLAPGWLILIAIIAALLAWWMYRQTQDLLSRGPQILLGIFRFIVLFLIGALLLEPLINSLNRVSSPPIIAILQDNSESIRIHKDSSFVKEEYPQRLKDFISEFDPSTQVVDLWSYSNDLEGMIFLLET